MKWWRITYFYKDGGSGLIIECKRVRKPSRLARAFMDDAFSYIVAPL